jgi:hypothetical protein
MLVPKAGPNEKGTGFGTGGGGGGLLVSYAALALAISSSTGSVSHFILQVQNKNKPLEAASVVTSLQIFTKSHEHHVKKIYIYTIHTITDNLQTLIVFTLLLYMKNE